MKVAIVLCNDPLAPASHQRISAITPALTGALQRRGVEVYRLSDIGSHTPLTLRPGTDAVLHVCRTPEALQALEESGARIINPPEAIVRCCNRELQLRTLDAAAVPQPAWVAVSTEGDAVAGVRYPVWVKRTHCSGDLLLGDVCFCSDASHTRLALSEMAARGIDRAILSGHIDGPTVRLLYVAPTGRLLPENLDEEDPANADTLQALEALCAQVAAALGLDAFCAEVVLPADGGRPALLDICDWPAARLHPHTVAQAIAEIIC